MKYYLLLTLLFVYCGNGETPLTHKKREGFHKHLSPENKSSIVWWFITRDPDCFPNDRLVAKYAKTILQNSQKIVSNYGNYGIQLPQPANIKPITLRITLLNDGCVVGRELLYCSNYQKVGSNAGITCSDGQSSLSVQTTGKAGSFVDCTLSFAASNILVNVGVYNACNYEIYYQ